MIYINTQDIFDIKNEKINVKVFNDCARLSKELNIFDSFGVNDKGFPVINLRGSKNKIALYYLKTMLKTTDKIGGLKRVLNILATR